MVLIKPLLVASLAVAAASAMTTAPPLFSLNPYNEYDSYYETAVRTALGTFHINLSHGNYSLNGPLVSPAIEWNINGDFILNRANFVAHLTLFNGPFHGLQVPDVYHIVDGNAGAMLYHLQGPQTGQFGTIPNEGRSIDVLGAEHMTFDKDALLFSLITVEELDRAASQLLGQIPTPSPGAAAGNLSGLLVPNPQTSPSFRMQLRNAMSSIHENFNSGQNEKNAALAADDVVVNADWVISTGKAAFVASIAPWQGAFPDMIFHDDSVLADGHLGAVEFVWEGTQTGAYTAENGTVFPPSGKSVRVRAFLFFEFGQTGLIQKVTWVHNEAVIATQLSSGNLYP